MTFAALIAVIFLLGCGSDDENGDGGEETGGDAAQTFPPHVVRDDDIEAQEEGSPERALLEWWQAFQFADAAGVESLTSEETLNAVGPRQLAALVKARGQGLQGVEVLGASTQGATSSVRVALLTFQPEKEGQPPPTTPTGSRPATITMAKVGNRWLFAETPYVRPMVENFRQAAREAQEQTETEAEPTETEEVAP
jgi:hypothetical protein